VPEPQRLPRLSWIWKLSALLIASVIVLVVTLNQSTSVSSVSEQAALDFGWPLAWITQDQTAFAPPMPHVASLASPLEHPFDIDELMLGLDVVLVWLACLAVLQGGRRLVRRLRRDRALGPGQRASTAGA
jgi:hypothetical protein